MNDSRYAEKMNLVGIFLLACSENIFENLRCVKGSKRLCSRISKVQQDSHWFTFEQTLKEQQAD